MMASRPRRYVISPAFCSIPATTVTVDRDAPSIIATNSCVSGNSSTSIRSRASRSHRARPAPWKVHVLDEFARLVQQLPHGQRRDFEQGENPLLLLRRQRQQQQVLDRGRWRAGGGSRRTLNRS